MKKFLLIALFAGGIQCLSAQTFKPGMKLQKGEQYQIVTTVNGSMEQAGMSMPIESTLKSLANVKNQTELGYAITTENTYFNFKSNMMGQELSYDSDKKDNEDNPATASFKEVAGKKDSFMVDKNGNLLPSPEKPALSKAKSDDGGMMSSMLNGAVAASGAPIFNIMPAFKELKIGEYVKDSSENKVDGKEKTVTTYTLAEIKDGKIKVTISSVTTMEKQMEVEQMGAKMNVAISSTINNTGEMFIDEATGVLISKSINSVTDGTASVMGMSIPVTGNTTTVTEVKKTN